MKDLQVLWTKEFPKNSSWHRDTFVIVGERGDPKPSYFSLEKGIENPAHFEVIIARTSEIDKQNVNSFCIGKFSFAPMYGCCGVVVSAFSSRENRDRTLHVYPIESEVFRWAKQEFAKALGYSAMIATAQMHNIPAVKNLFTSGYTLNKPFINKRTNNLLGFGFKQL